MVEAIGVSAEVELRLALLQQHLDILGAGVRLGVEAAGGLLREVLRQLVGQVLVVGLEHQVKAALLLVALLSHAVRDEALLDRLEPTLLHVLDHDRRLHRVAHLRHVLRIGSYLLVLGYVVRLHLMHRPLLLAARFLF